MLPRISTTSHIPTPLDTRLATTTSSPSSPPSPPSDRPTATSFESYDNNNGSRIMQDKISDIPTNILNDTEMQRKRRLSNPLSSSSSFSSVRSSSVSSLPSSTSAPNKRSFVTTGNTNSTIDTPPPKGIIPLFNFSTGDNLSVSIPEYSGTHRNSSSGSSSSAAILRKFLSAAVQHLHPTHHHDEDNSGNLSSSPPSTSSTTVQTPLKNSNHYHHHHLYSTNNSNDSSNPNHPLPVTLPSTFSSSSASTSSVSIPTADNYESVSPLHQIYESLTTNDTSASSSSTSTSTKNTPNLRIKKTISTNEIIDDTKDSSNTNSTTTTNDTPTPVSGTPLPFIQNIHNRHQQNHTQTSYSNYLPSGSSSTEEKTSSSGGTMIVTTNTIPVTTTAVTTVSSTSNINSPPKHLESLETIPKTPPLPSHKTSIVRKPNYTVESLLAMVPPLLDKSYVRYAWGLVCACNVNRSMSAHVSLTKQGFTKVYSYGTSDLVRLPSRCGPIPFYFGTPYTSMLQRLCSPYPEDSVWVTATGLRNMLERDADVKYCPQQWQSLISGGGPKATECGLIPPYISTNNLPITGNKHNLSASLPVEQTNVDPTVRVVDHDFVICFDLKVYEQVIMDLHYRGFLPSPSIGTSPMNSPTNNVSDCSSSNNNSIIQRLLTGNNSHLSSFFGNNGISSSSSMLSTSNASSVPEHTTTTTNSSSVKKQVHIILLHTRDNLADAAIAGRLATLLAHSICYAIEQKEEELRNECKDYRSNDDHNNSTSSTSTKRINRLWKQKFQQKLLSSSSSRPETNIDPGTVSSFSSRLSSSASDRILSSRSTTVDTNTMNSTESTSNHTTTESDRTTPSSELTEIYDPSDNETKHVSRRLSPFPVPSMDTPSSHLPPRDEIPLLPCFPSATIDYLSTVRTVLRDIEYKLDLPQGCMLYEEWYCYTGSNER